MLNDFRLIINLIPLFLHKKIMPLIVGFFAFLVFGNKIRNLRHGSDILWLTCVDFCDPFKMDLDMSVKYCEEIVAMKKGGDVVYAKGYDTEIRIRVADII